MRSGTTAVQSDWLARINGESGPNAGRPLCPACGIGRLHPYQVVIGLSDGAQPWHGADRLVGWVAVCKGNDDLDMVETPQPPCGFTLPMTPERNRHPWDAP
jgi:hypothetical protein